MRLWGHSPKFIPAQLTNTNTQLPTLNYQLFFAWFCNHLGEMTETPTCPPLLTILGTQRDFQVQNHLCSPKTPQRMTLKSCSNFIESQHHYGWKRPPWIIKSNHQSYQDNMPFSLFCNWLCTCLIFHKEPVVSSHTAISLNITSRNHIEIILKNQNQLLVLIQLHLQLH